MKYLAFIIIIFGLFSCKAKQETVSSKNDTEQNTYLKNPWEQIQFKPAKELVLPNKYTTYSLDIEMFYKQLEIGLVYVPNEAGTFDMYEVKNSNTMSPELQAKFPEIKSYAGINIANNLCQIRIDGKGQNYKLNVLCNDATIYIQELYDLGLYFIYNKKDLPEGVGTVKE